MLRYGPRHRVLVSIDEELEYEEGPPAFPERVPQVVWDEAREWWEECAGRCEEEKMGQ